VVLGVPEVPSVVVQDAEVVLGQTEGHEVVVQVAVPRDGQGNYSTLDRHPRKKKAWKTNLVEFGIKWFVTSLFCALKAWFLCEFNPRITQFFLIHFIN